MPSDPSIILCVGLNDATDRQILIALFHKIERLENAVSDLTVAVEGLQSSVTELTDTVENQLGPLQEELDRAKQLIADMAAADELEDEAFRTEINRLQGELEQSVGEASAAATAIADSTEQIKAASQAIDDAVPDVEPPVEPGGPTGPTGATGPEGGEEPVNP